MPTLGKAAENTALPQPPKTRTNVPMNSATSFRITSSVIDDRRIAIVVRGGHGANFGSAVLFATLCFCDRSEKIAAVPLVRDADGIGGIEISVRRRTSS